MCISVLCWALSGCRADCSGCMNVPVMFITFNTKFVGCSLTYLGNALCLAAPPAAQPHQILAQVGPKQLQSCAALYCLGHPLQLYQIP